MTDQVETGALTEVSLPDFIGVTSFIDIQKRFFVAAEKILRDYCLARSDQRWPITSLELYLHTASDVWRDHYTHCHDEQRNNRTWYVHRPPWALRKQEPPKHFCPVKRSGVDITCGSREGGIYAGILIQQTCGAMGSGTAFVRLLRSRPTFEGWSEGEQALIRNIDGSKIAGDELELRRSEVSFTGELSEKPRVGLRKRDGYPLCNPEGVSFMDAPLRLVALQPAKAALQ